MVEKRRPISVSEALERVLCKASLIGSEKVDLEESYGRILAEPIVASSDVPPFNRSPYDGYAIRSVDSAGASGDNRISFRVIDHIGAGEVSAEKLRANEAIRIMTGAQLPEGADAVVMFEQTVETEQGITIRKPFEALENVSLQGEDRSEEHTSELQSREKLVCRLL